MTQLFNQVFRRIDSNNVYCSLCDDKISRRLALEHWKSDDHKKELLAYIDSQISRFEEYLTLDPNLAMDVQPDTSDEPMDTSCSIHFVVSEGLQEHDVLFANHSWKLKLYLENSATVTLELNDDIGEDVFVIMEANAHVDIQLGNDTVHRSCPILFTETTYPVPIARQLHIKEGDNVDIRVSINVRRFELLPMHQEIEDDEDDEGQQAKRGRPVEYTRYNNLTNKLWLALFYNNRGRPFSANTLQQIFDVVHHLGFSIDDTARTTYLAFCCDDFFFDRIEASEFKFDDSEEVIRYHKPEHILEFILKTEDLTKDWVSSHSDDFDHPSSSEGWRVIQEHFQPVLDTQNALLVLVALWIDGFVGETSRNKTYTSISMTLANFPNSLACRQISRFCVANIPPTLTRRKKEFVDQVVVAFLRKLEYKELPICEFQGARKLPVGALHAIKGDHMSKIELAGVVAPSGKCSSFYTTVASDLFYDLHSEFRKLRDPELSREQIELINTLTGGEKTRMIQRTGLNGYVSPFWALPLVAKNFYQRFALCDLHQLFIGIVKTLAYCFGLDLNLEQRLEFNRLMRNMYPAEGYARITMNVFREGSNSISSLKGDMWLTFAAQSIILFKRYFGQNYVHKYRLWKTIMNGIVTIVTKKWTRDELQPEGELEILVYTLRKAMVDLFPNTDWSFPNFESLYAIPYQIAFLGPLHFQSTARDEEMNRRRRQIIQVGNGRQQANFLTEMIERARSAAVVRFENNDGQVVTYSQYINQRRQKKAFSDYDLIIPKEPKSLRPNYRDLERIMSLLNTFINEVAEVEVRAAYFIDGFFWHNKKVKSASAQSTKKRIKEIVLILDFEDKIVTGLFTSTFIVNVKVQTASQIRYYTLPFVSMRRIKFTNSEANMPVREGTMLKNEEFYPCGWLDCRLKDTATIIREGQTIFIWD